MNRDHWPTLVFFLALIVWGLGFSLLVGTMGCGGAQRRDCADAVNRSGNMQPCPRDR